MSASQVSLIVVFVIAVFLDWLLMKWLHNKQKKPINYIFTQVRTVDFSKLFLNFLAWLKNRNFELIVIAFWAIWVGRIYLNFDKNLVPGIGNDDFLLAIFPYFPFIRVLECGGCFLWNGLLNGGSPTLSDSIGGLLHPLMALSMLIFGVTNGIKVAMVISLIMGGWSQWWLAKVLDLKPVARLWVAFMAVVSGNLAGPLYSGDVGIVFSTAATSLVLAPAVSLALHGKRRDAILLGLMLAQAILAGQGYLQLALFTCVIPLLLIFAFDINRLGFTKLWKEIALSLIIAILVASIALIPWFHFGSQISRPSEPRSDQLLEYLPVNLIVRDMNFFLGDALGKLAAPNLYVMYIGWIPFLLAITAWRFTPRSKLRLFLFFSLSILLVFILGSGAPLRWAKDWLPGFLRDIRNPSFGVGLAVTLILGLAALGLDQILALKWPQIAIQNTVQNNIYRLDLRWILMPILLWTITSVYNFNQQFRYLQTWPKGLISSVEAISPAPVQWVRPLHGNWTFVAIAIQRNIKITDAYRIWDLINRPNPPMSLDSGIDPLMISDPNYIKTVEGIHFVKYPQTYYAFVDTGEEQIPCKATADGGHIQVTCNNLVAGELTVYENALSGWRVWRDGKSTSLDNNQWLQVQAPAGKHNYKFRYWPPDVMIGFIFTLIGLWLAFHLWNQNQPEPAAFDLTS
jgi:hypothetical protein